MSRSGLVQFQKLHFFECPTPVTSSFGTLIGIGSNLYHQVTVRWWTVTYSVVMIHESRKYLNVAEFTHVYNIVIMPLTAGVEDQVEHHSRFKAVNLMGFNVFKDRGR